MQVEYISEDPKGSPHRIHEVAEMYMNDPSAIQQPGPMHESCAPVPLIW